MLQLADGMLAEGASVAAAFRLQSFVLVVAGIKVKYNIGDTWRSMPYLASPFDLSCASCVLDDHLYLAGGTQHETKVTCFSNTWTDIAPMATPHAFGGAAVLDDRVYVCGNDPPASHVSCYNPATKAWTAAAPMPLEVSRCAVVALAGSLFVVGADNGHSVTSTLMRYTRATDAWTQLATLPQPRAGCSAVALQGLLYVMGGALLGGAESDINNCCECWSFSPATNAWTSLAPMPRSHGQCARAFVWQQFICVVGGLCDSSIAETVEFYDPTSNAWRP
eukprot:gnl/Hemi2/7562_TR2597_c0_g1_i1.p1 gnl/Hemi2/7562_TR2597_c0_g1~~gnl/Hemi2/7562_TR2597_c0_g1_i1.p1  ORF type:complete len:303 (-),score=70.47 gnl/Hemi2/7562_TR2597_c0_g1_i1:72-905(-)